MTANSSRALPLAPTENGTWPAGSTLPAIDALHADRTFERGISGIFQDHGEFTGLAVWVI